MCICARACVTLCHRICNCFVAFWLKTKSTLYREVFIKALCISMCVCVCVCGLVGYVPLSFDEMGHQETHQPITRQTTSPRPHLYNHINRSNWCSGRGGGLKNWSIPTTLRSIWIARWHCNGYSHRSQRCLFNVLPTNYRPQPPCLIIKWRIASHCQ